jgi:uncharacterized protein with beta-barrel porin domain
MDRVRGTANRIAIGGMHALAVAAVLFALGAMPAMAQGRTDPESGNVHVSGESALFDLGTRFLRHLGTEASNANAGPPLVSNPAGGGADLSMTAQPQQRWRAWSEGYGLWSHMSAQDTFPGDRRSTWGGVAGLGYTLAPGVSVGASVDQSRTKIGIVGLPQSATIDLTQVGANASFESGAWTFATAGIYGFGGINSRRDDIGGTVDVADYDARLWGWLGEFSYLWTSGNFRIVPKLGADWVRAEMSNFVETGGPSAVAGSSQTSMRTRVFAGAEFGHTWTLDRALFDLSAYGRAVGIVQQDISTLQVVGLGAPVSVQGVGESRLGADLGAAATYRLSSMMRFYAAYDGRFRSNFTSHTGTLGVELRW